MMNAQSLKAKAIGLTLTAAVLVGTVASFAAHAQSAAVAAAKPLTIDEKHRVVAPKETHLILLLDFFPNSKDLQASGADATAIITTTSARYAKEYLAKPEFKDVPAAIVYVVYVKSMDEYNRADYSGMKRFGTLTFKRDGADVTLSENKLTFTP